MVSFLISKIFCFYLVLMLIVCATFQNYICFVFGDEHLREQVIFTQRILWKTGRKFHEILALFDCE